MSIDVNSILSSVLENISLYSVLSALLSFLIGMLIIKFLSRLLYKALAKLDLSARTRQLLLTGIRTLCYVIIIVIAISKLGGNTSAIVALITVLSLGITLAVEDVLGNIAGGLVVLMTHPFNHGDYVSINGMDGTVSQIHINHTRLNTLNGEIIIIPNKEVSSSKVINYTHLGARRITTAVCASYDSPTDDVRAALLEAAGMQDTLLPEKEPIVCLTNYKDSNIEYSLYTWVKPSDYLITKMKLNEDVRTCFKKHGVEMSYNHMNIHMM